MKRALFSLSLAFVTVIAAPAAADVVSAPPVSCPAGSDPATCHGGPHCNPLLCGATADCGAGQVCKDVAYCVKTINCGGLLPPDADPSMYEKEAVDGVCTGACSGGAPCKTLKVCVAESTSSSSSSGSTGTSTSSSSGAAGGGESGGCSFAGGRGPLGAAFAAIAATAALSFARRRPRRR